MPKMMTPAIEKYNAKVKRRGDKVKVGSLGRDAWKRLCRNRTAIVGMVILAIMIIVAIFADVIAPYEPQEQIYADAYQGPSSKHIFGTDSYGRDLFSRCVYGTRYSLALAVACVLSAYICGAIFGLISGYFGGRLGDIIMRIMDILQGIPQVLLAICISASLGNGIPQMIVSIVIASLPISSKNCRAAVLSVRSAEFIEASKAIGVRNTRMIFRHVLPNSIGIIVVFMVNLMGGSINTMASLSYLGVGISPPTPEWGLILAGSKEFFTSHSYMVLFPAALIMIAILAFNMLGDGLRDALDPRLK